MTAVVIPLAAEVDPPISGKVVLSAAETRTCDFSGDGRLVDVFMDERSAWTSLGFYLAVPACALMILAIGIRRLFGSVTGTTARPS